MKDYSVLLNYPEFKIEDIIKKHEYWVVLDQATGDGEMKIPDWIFDVNKAFEFIVLAYAPDSKLASCKDFLERKKLSLNAAGINKDQWEAILKNRNFMISDMATRLFRELNDFNYELLMSTKEAVEALLEVVRKPVDTRLLDEKERNAIKAKKESYLDAKFLMDEIKKMRENIENTNPDIAEVLNKSVFRAGMAEKLALGGAKK